MNAWIFGAAALVATLIISGIGGRVRRQRRKRDTAVLRYTAAALTEEDAAYYKALRNRDSRLIWLNRHHPEFIRAARRDGTAPMEAVIAYYFDFRLILTMTAYLHPEVQLRDFMEDYRGLSLNEYEKDMEALKAQRDREKADRDRRLAEAEALEAERRRKQLEVEQARKAAAAELWSSLSEEEKENFRNADGADARKKSFGVSDFDGFPVTVLYPLVMATEFPHVRSHHDSSICDAESSASTSHHSDHGGGYSHHDSSSFHTDGGSHSSFDGGSSHVSFDGGGFCH